MRCAIYRRVSTDMQVEEGFSLEAQRMRLNAYVESQGWKIVEDYCDEGYSAKDTDRPQMQRLIADIKQKRFDVVVVYRLDRFVRSVLDLHELLQLMEQYDVKFKSATEIFDTTSATGRLFITLIASLAQWERETIAERVHMGMQKKVEQGERNGAPAPYGYDLVDRKLILNPDEARWVRYIFERYGAVGSQTLAKELNTRGVKTKKGESWSDFSVRYVLRNPIYVGLVRWNYETYAKGTRQKTGNEILVDYSQEDFEPLIDKETFGDVQLTMGRRSKMAFRSDNFYPFSGIIRCEKCGYGFTGASKQLRNGKIHRFYKCRGRINFGNCDVQAIAEEAIEEAFLNMLQLAETEIEIVQPAQVMSNEEIQKQVKQLTKQKERAQELYIKGDVTKPRYEKLLEDIKTEEKKLMELLASVSGIESDEAVKELLRNLKNEWSHFSHETKKQAVHSLFESMTIQLVEKAVPSHRKKAKVAIKDHKML